MPTVQDIAGFPCFEVEFQKDGSPNNPADPDDSVAFARGKGITDLFVISHGWNNDMAEARALYATFFAKVRGVLDRGQAQGLGGRKFGVLAILWPSKRFAEKDLIPSGAASVGAGGDPRHVREHLDDLKGFFDGPGADEALEKARALVPRLEDSPRARREFADLVRSGLPAPGPDPEGSPDRFAARDGEALMKQLKSPVLVLPVGSKAGAATGLGDVLGGIGGAIRDAAGKTRDAIVDVGQAATDAAERLLNLVTYYQMKERAGVVGRGGVYDLLRKIRDAAPSVRLHLLGHSFGGRLVASATLGPDGKPPLRPETLTLLQAAFSHNGFGRRYDGTHDGFFRRIVEAKRVAGPILITHTNHDLAVGLAYVLASRIAGQTGASVGDANDPFGGIGRNGAQHAREAVFTTLGPVGTAYPFAAGSLYNLHADVITGHSDIDKDEVAYALLTAVGKS